jgi:hypothetical protein
MADKTPDKLPDTTSTPVPEKVVVAEEKALAADISAAHAEKAADQAASDEEAAHKAALKVRPECPHCGTHLTMHDDVDGNMHCYSVACGGKASACCFAASDSGPALRSGATHRP